MAFRRNFFAAWFAACALATLAQAQVIEFVSGGLEYKALTKGGVTVMFAPLKLKVRDMTVLQVAVSNGAPVSWSIKPEDFRYVPLNGQGTQAMTSKAVIGDLLKNASRGDVTKLVHAYEDALYGNTQMHSTNGYEARRQDALAELGNPRLKAATAASAIALVTTKLNPGQSTDGAVFYQVGGKPLGAGHLEVTVGGELFTFPLEGDTKLGR